MGEGFSVNRALKVDSDLVIMTNSVLSEILIWKKKFCVKSRCVSTYKRYCILILKKTVQQNICFFRLEQLKHYLKEGGMALQLGGAEGSHRTEAGPEMDIGE